MWYYVLQGERKGPVEAPEFFNLIKQNIIKSDDYIWKKGFDNWKKLEDVEELSSYLHGTPDVSSNFVENSNFELETVANFAQAGNSNPVGSSVDFNSKTGEYKIPSVLTVDWKNIDENENRFYILVGKDRNQPETQYGPYSLTLIKRLFQENRINGKTFIWNQGMENWSMLADLPNFQEIFNVVPPEISESEKRDNMRRPFVARMFFHDNAKLYEGVCRDISTGGMQVLVSNFPGRIGDKISINVHPDNSEYHFVASGKVVRILEGNNGFSFRFIDLKSEAENAIKAYISNENSN